LPAGLHRGLLPALRRAVVQHPLDEALHARLVLSVAADGRRGEALRTWPELLAVRDRLLRGDRGGPAGAGRAPAAPLVPAQLPPDLPCFCGRMPVLAR